MKSLLNQLTRSSSIAQFIGLATFPLITVSLTGQAIAAELLTNNPHQVGIVFDESSLLNSTTLVQPWVNHETVYQETGVTYERASCSGHRAHYGTPSSVIGPTVLVSSGNVTPYPQNMERLKARFVSNKTLPAPGLRVVVRNLSIGGNTIPYTDREYTDNRFSEKFYIFPYNEHRMKYLAVTKGDNRMSYEIKRGNQVLESGEFIVKIAVDDRYSSVTKTIPREVVHIPCPQDYDDKHHDDHHDDHHHRKGKRRRKH
jgi:hypothetical protein